MKDKFGYELEVGDHVVWYKATTNRVDDSVGIVENLFLDRYNAQRASIFWDEGVRVDYLVSDTLSKNLAKIGTPECTFLLLTTNAHEDS